MLLLLFSLLLFMSCLRSCLLWCNSAIDSVYKITPPFEALALWLSLFFVKFSISIWNKTFVNIIKREIEDQGLSAVGGLSSGDRTCKGQMIWKLLTATEAREGLKGFTMKRPFYCSSVSNKACEGKIRLMMLVKKLLILPHFSSPLFSFYSAWAWYFPYFVGGLRVQMTVSKAFFSRFCIRLWKAPRCGINRQREKKARKFIGIRDA